MDRHYAIIYRNGIFENPSSKTVYIGQSPGCDIRVPNNSEFEDEIIAKIDPDRDGEGWHLVRLSGNFSLSVNGVQVNRVAYLRNHDLIQVEGEKMRFEVKDGDLASTNVYHVTRSNSVLLWSIGVFVLLLGGIVAWLIYAGQRENLSDEMKRSVERSLYTVRVDSLHLMNRDSLVDVYYYTSPPVGTAFLTEDSLLVTARHCLQPWLNVVAPQDYGLLADMEDETVRMALKAETRNQLEGNDAMRVISYITLTSENGDTISLNSENFFIDEALDEIVETGSYELPQYWRSISYRYNRRDMMMGDLAYAKVNMKGSIPLASASDINRLLKKKGVKLTFFGHPVAGVTGSRLELKTDELRLPLETIPELPDRTFLLAHEGLLTPGFSGGPVIVRDGAGFRAVGVVSVTDDRNGYRSYSVPTNEIKK